MSMQSDLVDDLGICTGLSLDTIEGRCSFGDRVAQDLLHMWINAGCIGVVGSCLESLKVSITSQGTLHLRDATCEANNTGGFLRVRGQPCCRACLQAANRDKVLEQIREWCHRIGMVELVHVMLAESAKQLEVAVQRLEESMPQFPWADYGKMSYPILVQKVRSIFLRIPTAKQNEALKSFIGRSIKFLTPTMIAGLDGDVRGKIISYVEALSKGRILPNESAAIDALLSLGLILFDFKMVL